MGIATMILGQSGTGKSASLRNLDPKKTTLIQIIEKPLPFKSSQWERYNKEDCPNGLVFVTDKADSIVKILKGTQSDIIVIDDFQYLLANEFMRRVLDVEVGNQAFAKYNEIAHKAWMVLSESCALAKNKRVYILTHEQTDDFGKTKIKTIGKLLDEKIVLEGLVTIVLRSQRVNGNYVFSTQNSGQDTVKTPMGMFEQELIENDLSAVDSAICEYYGIQSTQTKAA